MVKNRTNLLIRFSDVDVLGIVWHGKYSYYFEDGREAFGNEFGLSYQDVYAQGYVTPIVHLEIDYKRSLKYGDQVYIETTYVDCEAAKIILDYKIVNENNDVLITGRTVQVFLDRDSRQLVLTVPPFFLNWKESHFLV